MVRLQAVQQRESARADGAMPLCTSSVNSSPHTRVAQNRVGASAYVLIGKPQEFWKVLLGVCSKKTPQAHAVSSLVHCHCLARLDATQGLSEGRMLAIKKYILKA